MYLIGGLFLLSFVTSLSSQIAGTPDEEKAKKELQNQWSKKFPGDRILSVQAAGKPKLIEKESPEENLPADLRYKFSFFVTSRKKEGQTTKTPVGVIYHFVREKGWVFSDIGMARSVVVTEPGKEPPTKDEVYQLVEEAILEEKGKSKSVESIRLTEPEFGQNLTPTKEQFWFRYEGDFEISENGSKTVCTEVSIRLVKEQGSAVWKAEWDEKGKCKPSEE
ncbi:hypothetical protein EHQ64_14530 [Leptospira sarikeiensis]|uniref:Uncharacterized protein n=1 Tax=Leptospira sarikeiensis TaxID=2484943 RepID=A0A4R9K8Y5_9LEPT|nr:hypothetical protein EHQ64_14530 [Leptospira sarikeiensis]